jgi:putative chitobiose transport system substrate-binding protein
MRIDPCRSLRRDQSGRDCSPSGPCDGRRRQDARAGRTRRGRLGEASLPTTVATIAVAILMFVASACGPRERDPNVVEFWTLQLSPTFDDYINGMIATFEADHPSISVRWVDVPYEGITQKFLSAIAGGRAPDVVNLPADYVRKYVELGALVAVDTLLAPDVVDSYFPSAREPLALGRHLYGLPWYLSTQILIYDRAKIEAAGFDPSYTPVTYQELLAFSRAYHERTGEYAFFFNVVVDSYLTEILESEGISMVSEDGTRATFNTPEAVARIEEWVETFRQGAMPRQSISQGHRGGLSLFQSGTIAMFIGGPQYLLQIEQNAPGIYRSTDVAPAPVGDAGKMNLAVMALSVTTTTANAPAAAAFAAFVTNAENQLEFARTVPIYPSVMAAVDDPYFHEHDGSLEGRARVIGASQLHEAEVLKPVLGNYNRLMENLKGHLLKAFLGDRSVQASLDAAAADWNKILAEDW